METRNFSVEKCKEKQDNCTVYYQATVFNRTHLPYLAETTEWKEVHTEEVFKLIVYAVVIVGGILGNVSVISTVLSNKSMRTTINFYVANLAAADALVCVICMVPHSVMTLSPEPVYHLGPVMCKLHPFTQMTCLLSSVFTLSTISCDRFVAVMYPLRARITKRRPCIILSVIWIVSAVISLPMLIFRKYMVIHYSNFTQTKCYDLFPIVYYYDEAEDECKQDNTLKLVYYATVPAMLFFLPVTVMLTAYSLILWRVWKEGPGERHAASVDHQSRTRKKVNKMVFVVLVAFIICWSPLMCIALYGTFFHNPTRDGALPEWYTKHEWYALFVAYSNSFFNPIIYGGFNKTFRDGFCKALLCGYNRNSARRAVHRGIRREQVARRRSSALQSFHTTLTSLRSRTMSYFTSTRM